MVTLNSKAVLLRPKATSLRSTRGQLVEVERALSDFVSRMIHNKYQVQVSQVAKSRDNIV